MENLASISVIIPVFNVDAYLPEALDSVINQTYKNLEIIIIDDGSTDESPKICDDYAKRDKRIFVIHQANKGVSAARNAGLDFSTGEYIAFLDPDDKFQLDFCEKLLSFLEQNEADMVMCKNMVCYTNEEMEVDDNNTAGSMPAIRQGIYDRTKALRNYTDGLINPNLWNKIYRASLWKEIRFPVGHVYEDLDVLFLVIDRCKKVCVWDEVLYYRRRHFKSITKTFSRRNARDLMLAFSHYEAFVLSNIPEVFAEEHLKNVYQSELRQLIVFYIRMSRNNGKEEKAFLRKLRNRILILGHKAGIRNNSKPVRIGYWVIRFCPVLVNIFSTAHYFVRTKCK